MKTTRVVLRTKPSQPYHYQFNNHQASITMHRPGLKWNQGKQSCKWTGRRAWLPVFMYFALAMVFSIYFWWLSKKSMVASVHVRCSATEQRATHLAHIRYLIFFSRNVMIWRNEGDTAESYCAGYIVAAEHEDENIDSSVVLAAESAPAEYPCQVSDSSVVLLKPLGLSQETFDKQRNQ
jgi:hypothetical protein